VLLKRNSRLLFCLFGLISALIIPFHAQAIKFPEPVNAVNDFAEVIPPEYEDKMNQLARALWNQTRTAFVVATFQDLGGESPEEFSSRLYEAWGIGEKGDDRGILILLTLKERRIRIETGYGMEGILPDAKVGGIMDQYIVPYLRRGEFGRGLFNGMMALAQVVALETGAKLDFDRYAPGPAVKSKGKKGFPFLIIFLLFFIFGLLGRGMGLFPFFFFPWIFMGGGRGRIGGSFGGFGGGFGGFGGGMSGGGGATRGF
jgi:uncharacterized protein